MQTDKKDFIIWIGHSTTLIRTAGHFFLCDPVFSERLFFTKRKREPGIETEVLNEVFGNENLNILITHNHYDHLDIKSLKKLRINGCIYAPAGSKKLLKKVKAGLYGVAIFWKQRTEIFLSAVIQVTLEDIKNSGKNLV